MKCDGCNVNKLSKEFPPRKLTTGCKHPSRYCMRCVIAYVNEHKKCPHHDCDEDIMPDSKIIKLLQHTLDQMFTVYKFDVRNKAVTGSSSLGPVGEENGVINVSILTGETIQLPLKENMTVTMLKCNIQEERGYKVGEQKLLLKNRMLKDFGPTGDFVALSEYGVQSGDTLHLMIMMYAIPDNFDRVIFALSWGYPTSGKDYLDASCLLFSETEFIEAHDYRQIQRKDLKYKDAVLHSGDLMDDKDKIGLHIITVFLKKMPSDITHIFFTLSAFLAPNITAYPSKAIHFLDAANPNKSLCETTFSHEMNKQAVVMCYVKRKGDSWEIYQSGQLSAGNATYYKPLSETISKFIETAP